MLFENEGEEKSVTLNGLYEETEMECSVREAQKIDMRNFTTCIDELEQYNIFKVERNKKDNTVSTI
jgi:hypothetical protein